MAMTNLYVEKHGWFKFSLSSNSLSLNSIEKFFYNPIHKDRKHEIVCFILNCPEV